MCMKWWFGCSNTLPVLVLLLLLAPGFMPSNQRALLLSQSISRQNIDQPRRKAGFFIACAGFTQLRDAKPQINPPKGGGVRRLERRWCVHRARASLNQITRILLEAASTKLFYDCNATNISMRLGFWPPLLLLLLAGSFYYISENRVENIGGQIQVKLNKDQKDPPHKYDENGIKKIFSSICIAIAQDRYKREMREFNKGVYLGSPDSPVYRAIISRDHERTEACKSL